MKKYYLCKSYFKKLEHYFLHTLSNGLKIAHIPSKSDVCFCGVIVNAGSRDEMERENGMAHFIEHLLFKGTRKYTSKKIIEKLETVGGELNAFTSKEETVVYACILKKHAEKAVDLLADIVQRSQFPEREIEKERTVIFDEIESYNDSPSELIFDDFEDTIFGNGAMGHNILGAKKSLKHIKKENILTFYRNFYSLQNMVFFSVGGYSFEKLINLCEKYFIQNEEIKTIHTRQTPFLHTAKNKLIRKKTNQSHCVIGAAAYDFHSESRLSLYLLNNILGGPGMNSLLNLSLREKNGYAYTVESHYQPFTDCGWWAAYFGTDHENTEKCEKLVKSELEKLREQKISEVKLKKYKQQLQGQLAISSDNKENLSISLGKSILRYGKFDSMKELQHKLNEITSQQLQEIANDIFHPEKLITLKYI